MTSLPYVIGVDGGATKTAALLADSHGRVLGAGSAGSSNYQKVGFEPACSEILQAIGGAFAAAGLPAADPAAICLGLAGVDRAEDQQRFLVWARARLPLARLSIVNDAELPLAAGTPDGWGVGVICGTGATCVGRSRSGHMLRADGWGYILGDDGSGYSIGQNALRAIMRAHDGRGPETSLTRTILDFWRLASPEELLEHVYVEQATPAEIAALAVIVDQCAEGGDAVAQGILSTAGTEIATSIGAVVHRLGMEAEAVPCALAGGVVTRSRLVRETLLAVAPSRGLRLEPVEIVLDPVAGALRLALRLL